jgi:hypothetical protein
MHQFSAFAISLIVLLAASVAQAQPDGIKEIIDKNLLLEKDGKFREAYAEWAKFMKIPGISGANLADVKVQKIWFTAYFYQTRTLYKTALHDKDIKDRPKLIAGAAKSIVDLESKSQTGWKIAGPMFEEFFKEAESDQLKKAYDKLKSERK